MTNPSSSYYSPLLKKGRCPLGQRGYSRFAKDELVFQNFSVGTGGVFCINPLPREGARSSGRKGFAPPLVHLPCSPPRKGGKKTNEMPLSKTLEKRTKY